jgi:hypothetical protein
MLSIGQKESILRKEGAVVPTFPNRNVMERPRYSRRDEGGGRGHEIDPLYEQAVREWRATVEALYASWLTARR